MSRFMIAFGPPEYSQRLSDRWENYFKESILPKMKGCKWSQEKSGWGYLEFKDVSRVLEVMDTYGWKMGENYWGSWRFDPVRQEPPSRNLLSAILWQVQAPCLAQARKKENGVLGNTKLFVMQALNSSI